MDDGTPRRHALVIMGDAAARQESARIAAAAECFLIESAWPVGRPAWTRATVVLLDAETARMAAQELLPRRPGVVVIADGVPALEDWQSAAAIGADNVLGLPGDESVLVALLGERPEAGSGRGAVIAVLGGRGGAGASTFAGALALTANATQFREHCLLVDGDGHGGGIDLLLGAEHTPGLRWPALVLEGGRVSAAALHAALPAVQQGVSVLACGRGDSAGEPSAAAVRAVVEAGRNVGDLVIGDIPRRGCDVAEALVESADLVVLVVPAELRASAAAEVVARYAQSRNSQCGLVVRGPAPGGLQAADIAKALGLPLLAAMRPEPRLSDRLERGGLRLRKRGPLRTAAESVLDAVAERSGVRRWVA
ncbi:septum site-determining protein Ssd [Antrihabitans sp. YC2-6]|uniref:septum site-determining protein Ssd n=1 Tax=Antrihabitans sp. YC2-6 TaxID=2799498 RepID=UPI0018F60098|nr:septum site-determining protein Ssd [Antrihabitans sp. YC2-6]MBJ8346049.1 hypothetical protein [Antrihabitans sp. YC2-6]